MQANVSRKFLESLSYSPWDLSIPGWNSQAQCRARVTSSHVVFTIPYTGCGTIKKVSAP